MSDTACTYLPWDGIVIKVQKLGRKKYEARVAVQEGFHPIPHPGKGPAVKAALEARGQGKTQERAIAALTTAMWQVLKSHALLPVGNSSTFTFSSGDTAATSGTMIIHYQPQP